MRRFLIVLMMMGNPVYARLSTFNELDTVQMLQQGVTVFAQADIDRDGDIDWVAPKSGNSNIAVIFNEQHGKTSTIICTPSVYKINALDLGDVDGDSIADVLVAGTKGPGDKVLDYPADMTVILTGTNGRYDDSVDIPGTSVVIAARFMDVNGDLRNDILLVSEWVCWYENGASGWTRHMIDSTVGLLGEFDTWLNVVDFNGDGKVDFLLGSGKKRAIVRYLNDGTGNFTKKTIASGISASRGVAADIDLDGDLDILTGREIIRRDGDAFTVDTISDPPTNDADAVAAGDVNNDGWPDIVAAVWDEGTFLWQSGPGKKFTRSPLYSVGDVKDVSIVDADFDRFNDIVSIDEKGGVLRCSRNSGVFAFERKILFNYPHLADFETLDMHNDGHTDFLLARNLGGPPVVSLYQDSGNGGYKGIWGVSRASDDFVYEVKATDLNEDGLLDIVATGSTMASWYEQTAPQQFTEHRFTTMSVRRRPVQIVDLNADGHSDVTGLFLSSESRVCILAFYNDGKGQFTLDTLTVWPQVGGEYFKINYYIDADGDGRVESNLTSCESCSYIPFDVNNDTRQDLLCFASDTSWFIIRENTGKTDSSGNRIFTAHWLMRGAGEMACGDLDRDGRDDAVILDINKHSLEWMAQDTLFGFLSLHTIDYGSCAVSVKVLDFDGDGWKDVVCADTGDNIVLYRNLLGVPKATVEIPTPSVVRGSDPVRATVTLRAIGNGRYKWELPSGIVLPKLRFFLMNGAAIDLPVSIVNGRCIADAGRFHGGNPGIIVWALSDGTGKPYGAGLLTAGRMAGGR